MTIAKEQQHGITTVYHLLNYDDLKTYNLVIGPGKLHEQKWVLYDDLDEEIRIASVWFKTWDEDQPYIEITLATNHGYETINLSIIGMSSIDT